MVILEKPIKRETRATVFERSEHKPIVVSVEPAGRDGAQIGVRLKGTRDTYRIGVNSIFNIAVQHHLAKIEKKAKEIHKLEKVPMRSARARARKEVNKDLR